MTRIDTIVSTVEVRAHFAKFGSIQDYDLKLDRSTGSHLGVAYVSYVDKTVWDEKAGKFTTQGMDQDGGLVASLAVQQTDGQKIGRSAAAGGEKGVVRCWLDRDGTKGIAEENAELKRRADRRRAERERAQRSQRPSSSGTSRASVNGPGESSTGQQLEASSSKHQRPSLSGDTVASSSSIDAIVAQASKQIIQDLRESMERRIRHNFVSQAVEDRLIKRIKLDKKAVVAPPPVPTGPRHSVSNSGQYVVPYFITAPAMLSMPPTLPTSPPKASTFSNLPGAVTLPATAHPPPMFNVSALQPSSSHVPNQHISKLPSFKPKANKLKDKTSPPLAKQQKLPSPAAIDTASSEPSESSRRRSSKSPSEPDKTASVRAHSPPSSLSSVHSGVAVSEDDDGTKDEDEESDSDSDASEDEDFPPLSRSPPRPNKELQRDPSNLGKLKAKRHPLSKASKVVDWTTSEAEDSDGDQSAQSEDKPLQSLGPQMSPKRQPTHVLNNGHGVKQIGSPVRVQPSHKSSTAEPLAPVTTKPRVILEEEFKVAPEKNLQSPASLPNSSQHTLLSPITPALETGVTELAPETPAFPTSPPKLQEHQQQLGEPFQLEAEPDTPGERDLYRLGLVADEEDFYYIRRVLERRRHGLGMRPDEFMKEPVFREEALDIPSHSTGSARTEGYYKLQAGAKAALLPQRNRAMVDTTLSASSVAISRSSRAESRRAAGGATTGNATSDSDIIKFNQLKSRGKLLKFSRSPIR